MHEERGRSGRCERSCELARDMSRLADSRDDDAPAATEHQLDCRDEIFAEARRQRGDRGCFGVEHFPRKRQRARMIDRAGIGAARFRAYTGVCGHCVKYTARHLMDDARSGSPR